MQEKLVELAAAAEKAAMLQVSAQEQQAAALQTEETVSMERAEAAELEEEASILLAKSEADVVLAAEEQVQAAGMAAEVATEEEQSLAHAAASALDETTADTELAEATTDATQAARAELQAHGEEVGIGICEFVPGLDVLCSVLGGITAVGAEGFAAGEGVKASSELAAATLAKAHEEREIALAAEFQVKATQDSTAAAELESQQVAEEELAEEERIEGEEKHAQADALLEHAEVEEDTAVEEEAMAGEEMDEAASLVASSIATGASACWDAIMATLFGIAAFLFFGIKTIAKILPPIFLVLSAPKMATSGIGGTFVRNTSYTFHHGLIFLLNSGIFSNILDVFGKLSLRARGGLVLGFAAAGASVQTLALHLVPGYLSGSHTCKSLFAEVVRCLICLSFLFALELLILWAAFGERLFTIPLLQSLNEWVWWVMFSVPLGCHLVFLEIPHVSQREGEQARDPEPSECIGSEDAKESDSLLPTKTVLNGTSRVQTIGWWCQIRADLAKMQLPFEILMTTCMTGLLMHCVGATITLWPTSKTLLLTNRPDWVGELATVAAIFGICVMVIVMWRRRKQASKVDCQV